MEIALVFPHQLFARHPALAEGREVLLIEHPLYFGNDAKWPLAVHKQRLVLHRASMMAYAEELRGKGHPVSYVETPGDGDVLQTSIPHETTSIHLADPVDDVLLRRVRRLAEKRGVELVIHDTPGFLSPSDFLNQQIGSKKKPFMATFYQAQRRRMGILLEADGSPAGGKWSFDEENRARLPKGWQPPHEPRAPRNAFVEEAIDYVLRRFPENPGEIGDFRWPVTRADSLSWLDDFLQHRFAGFGAYEDAISTRHAFLNHAAITPMLNIGLLEPAEVIDRALSFAARHGNVPLNSLEGFVRQLIGWREFMRGIYQIRGVEIRNGNFWNFDRPLPAAFYDGSTGIPPVDRVIRQVLREGYCHHIERLMVLGNFMLLCRIRPDDVCRWFMEMFVDAYDWVMVPNVYGMSQFADGGTFTTKPYISGSNYVLKMSDEPKGDWCAVWDGLFWTFIADHLPFFGSNPRLSMMARSWMKMTTEKQHAHRRAAEGYLTIFADAPDGGG
jgi:deoxyribodipyrimidine photolyase-related protein